MIHVSLKAFISAAVCSLLLSCGGPAAPDAPTEAQVIVVGDATWTGFFGTSNEPHEGNTGTSAVLKIGSGRQCATVSKHGSGDRTRTSRMTVRVGENSESTTFATELFDVVTACGTGPLR